MGSFSIPLSGLDADSTALNTIANNLANLNTTGFKSQTANFSDLFYQQVGSSGSGDPIQVGGGTQVTSTETDYSNGTPTATGNASDVALQGAGFFIVQGTGAAEYTRDGTFSVTNDGALETQGGLSVMGYAASGGVVNTDGSLVALQIPIGQAEAPKTTTDMNFIANLDSTSGATASTGFGFSGTLGATAGTATVGPITLYDSLGGTHAATVTLTNGGGGSWGYSIAVAGSTSGPATGTLTFNPVSGALTSTTPVTSTFSGFADGSNAISLSWDPSTLTQIASATNAVSGQTQVGGGPVNNGTFQVPVAVYDSLGNQQQAEVAFTRSVTAPNTWSYAVTLPTAAYGGAAGASNTGTISFNSSGQLATVNGVTASATTGSIPISFAGLSDGAANLAFKWDLYNTNGAPILTQVAQASSNTSTYQNGYAPGTYEGYAIDSTGLLSAKFTNGQTTAIGQLAVASIVNQQGLSRLGDNNYGVTNASGAATDGVAGLAGLGTIQDSALEGSNVDISTEFADLIVAQRGFEADSTAVTTFDTVAQETINLIH
jgi:flagellar hook protein FlgE